MTSSGLEQIRASAAASRPAQARPEADGGTRLTKSLDKAGGIENAPMLAARRVQESLTQLQRRLNRIQTETGTWSEEKEAA